MKKFKVSPNEREDQLFFAFRSVYRTVEQFKRHITEDVLPPLLDNLSKPRD